MIKRRLPANHASIQYLDFMGIWFCQELLAKEVIYQDDLERLVGPRPTGETHLTEEIPQVISSEPQPEAIAEGQASTDATEG